MPEDFPQDEGRCQVDAVFMMHYQRADTQRTEGRNMQSVGRMRLNDVTRGGKQS